MKDYKRVYRGPFNGWWLVAALGLLLLDFNLPADAAQLTPADFASPPQGEAGQMDYEAAERYGWEQRAAMRRAGKLDDRWLIEFSPWGSGHWSMVVGTGSTSLAECHRQGKVFLGMGSALDTDTAIFTCQKECSLAQDNSGMPDCEHIRVFTVEGLELTVEDMRRRRRQ